MENNEKLLNAQEKSIATIAAFTAIGDMPNLKIALNEGLEAGLTINQIKEILIQMYAYCGFPRSLNGLNTFKLVLDERLALGIKDELGPEASAPPADLNRAEYGKNVRLKLRGLQEEGSPSGYQVFAPVIDTFLKEHLFADIFYRDNLSYLNREIATVAALASLVGTGEQLQVHMNMAMNIGLTKAQLKDLIEVINNRVSKVQANMATEVYNRVIKNK